MKILVITIMIFFAGNVSAAAAGEGPGGDDPHKNSGKHIPKAGETDVPLTRSNAVIVPDRSASQDTAVTVPMEEEKETATMDVLESLATQKSDDPDK